MSPEPEGAAPAGDAPAPVPDPHVAVPGAPVTGAPRAGPRAWVPSLQSLRGLAALWVVLYHLDVTLHNHQLDLLPFPGPRIGWLGVDLFYVLSAYLLGQPFLDGRARPYLRFLGDRFLRIAPAYYAAVVVAAVCFIAIAPADWSWAWASVNLAFLSNYHYKAYFALNPAFWSLAVEMQFYLVLPLLAKLFTGRRWPLGLALCVAATCAFRAWTFRPDDIHWLFAGTFGLPAFLAHFGLGLAAARFRAVARPALVALAGMALVLAPTLLWITPGSVVFGFDDLQAQVLVRPIAAAGFALVILAAATQGALQAALSLAPLRWLGDVSYSLYLVHIAAQWVVEQAVGLQPTWVYVVLGTAASVAAGAALHYGVERPAERWRHQRKLRQRVAAQAAAASG